MSSPRPDPFQHRQETIISQPSDLVKCLVWDLDDTLWRGVLLEDGDVRVADEIRAVVADLDSRGILQSVASKNDQHLAWPLLQELGLADYFVLPKIGWGPKSASIHELADQLKFAHRTIAFIDDQPVERAEVSFHLPDIRVYAAEQATSLTTLPEFSPKTVTADSRQRRLMYQAGLRRDSEREAFIGSSDEFLLSLDIAMDIVRAGPEDISRVEELTLRTSQMNATGIHYSDADLRRLLLDPDHEVLVVNMKDRFGPHGAVGVVLLRRYATAWHIKLLATSCRVVSTGAGAVILNWLADTAAAAGRHLIADFRPTDRNRVMEIAYRFSGFETQACACLTMLDDDPAEDGVQRLHQVPSRRPGPSTMALTTPDLVRATVTAEVR